MITSATPRNTAKITLVIKTTMVVPTTSSREGKETFFISDRTSPRKVFALLNQFIANSLSSSAVAGQEGLEPPTFGFGDRCSTS